MSPLEVFTAAPIRRLRDILLYSDLEFAELVTSIAALTWGGWLLLPWVEMYAPGRPALNELALLAPQSMWAGVAIGIGTLQALALAREWRRVRDYISAAAFVLWLAISLLFVFVGDHSNPHAPVYGILAFAAGWAHLRVAVMAVAHIDDQRAAIRRCSDL